MCAVIGAVIRQPSFEDLDTLRRVFLESQIRGMHATGLSYVKSGKIYTEKLPVPANEFPFRFEEYINEDGNLYLIGHCRYSTSDLEYNQPISNEDLSVVHNGVITQEPPEKWSELYGYECVTKNDTELILHTSQAGVSPLLRWKASSLAVCELHSNKVLRVYRNGKRPLYLSNLVNGCIITSTLDVASRANVGQFSVEIPMNVYTAFDDTLTMSCKQEIIEGTIDHQHYEFN